MTQRSITGYLISLLTALTYMPTVYIKIPSTTPKPVADPSIKWYKSLYPGSKPPFQLYRSSSTPRLVVQLLLRLLRTGSYCKLSTRCKGSRSRYRDYATDWRFRGSNTCKDERFFSVRLSISALGSTQPL